MPSSVIARHASRAWVPVWSLQDSITAESNKSFEELVLYKMKGPASKAPAKTKSGLESQG